MLPSGHEKFARFVWNTGRIPVVRKLRFQYSKMFILAPAFRSKFKSVVGIRV